MKKMPKVYKIAPRPISKVLIVDPDQNRATLVRECLRSLRIAKVGFAPSIGGMFRQFSSENYDLVVVCGKGERGTGKDVVHALRTKRDPLLSRKPVIEILISPTQKKVSTSIAIGVDEMLAWPISIDGLRKRMHKIESNARIWVDLPAYFGPCRRRAVNPDYSGFDRRGEGAYILAA